MKIDRKLVIIFCLAIYALYATLRLSERNEPASEPSARAPAPRTVEPRLIPSTAHYQEPLPEHSSPSAKNDDGPLVLTVEQIRSLRSSLKVDLVGLYTDQLAFAKKHGRHTTDLKLLGWTPSAVMAAKVGFLRAFDPQDYFTREDPEELNSDVFLGEHIYSKQSRDISFDALKAYCKEGCTATEKKFEIIAAVNLDSDPKLDVWLLNEKKELVHVSDDFR